MRRAEALTMKDRQPEVAKYGARLYGMGDTLLIKQTILRGVPPEYVIDEHRERHVASDDDSAVAAAIRDAVKGKL